jgi:hypothetical protein
MLVEHAEEKVFVAELNLENARKQLAAARAELADDVEDYYHLEVEDMPRRLAAIHQALKP